jgi:hypothetical protein
MRIYQHGQGVLERVGDLRLPISEPELTQAIMKATFWSLLRLVQACTRTKSLKLSYVQIWKKRDLSYR